MVPGTAADSKADVDSVSPPSSQWVVAWCALLHELTFDGDEKMLKNKA